MRRLSQVFRRRSRRQDLSPETQDAGQSVVTVVTSGGEPVHCRQLTYLGHVFCYPEASQIGAAIAGGWDWDQVLRPIVETLLPERDPIICEVGSNIGASTLEILAVRPQSQITCYEPSDRYRAVLEHNLASAGYGKADVRVRDRLVDREPGLGHIYTDETSGRIHHMSHLTRAQAAPVVCLDDEFAERAAPLRMLKSDTDGNDIEVLRGAERLLREDRPVLFIELCPVLMATDPVDDLAWLQSLGYRDLVCLDNHGRHVGTTRDPAQATDWSTQLTYCDILAAAEGTEFSARMSDIPLLPQPPSG